MGNVSAKEGANDSPRRVHSLDLMGSSTTPLLFSPQNKFVPIAPLQRVVNAPPVHDQFRGSSNVPAGKGIPILLTWNYEGNDVSVEGSWDNWTSRKALQRMGKDHSILLVLPSGVYHYKFIVDGEWRYIPDLPCVADEMGRMTNLLDVNDYVPENLEGISELQFPPSPDSSYNHSLPSEEDFAKEPPCLPPQLSASVLSMCNSGEAPKRPQHVVLNHLFAEQGWGRQSLVALGLTHRFKSKYVTVVLYKPLRR